MAEPIIDETQETSSTSTDETQETSSTSTEQSQATQTTETLESVVQKAVQRSEASSASTQEGKEAAGDVGKSNKTAQEKSAEGEEGKEDTSKAEDDQEEKGPIPYDRFNEVNTRMQTAETKLAEYETQWKPLVEKHQALEGRLRDARVVPEQFEETLDMLRLINTDPIAARQKIQPLLDYLDTFTGAKLPNDLQADVDAGTLPIERAKEIASLRMKSQFGERQSQQTVEQMRAAQAQQFVGQLQNDLTSWINAKRKTDIDFQPKKPDAKDGKYELFVKLLSAGINPQAVKSSADLIRLAEGAYEDLQSYVTAHLPKRTNTPRVRTERSSANGTVQPKTIEEVIAASAAKHGIEIG